MTSSTTSSSPSASAAAAPKKAAEMEKILAEIRSHEKSALFAGNTSAHNPDLQVKIQHIAALYILHRIGVRWLCG
jgi:hypothetical protein